MEPVASQIDREYLSEISGGDVEFEQDLVQTFLDVAPGLIDSFRSASGASDAQGARHAAHTLKGSSRSIGASNFAQVCEQAEKAAREEDLEACRTLVASIESAFAYLKADAENLVAQAA